MSETFSLDKFQGGELLRRVTEAMDAVRASMDDPSTSAVAQRRIDVSITFKPHKSRQLAEITIGVKPTLPPELPHEGTLFTSTGQSAIPFHEYDDRQDLMPGVVDDQAN